MRTFLLGFLDSHIYEETTAFNLARDGDFIFRKGLDKNERYSSEDTLIRYGDYTYPSYDSLFGRVINKARAIRHNCNKLRTHVFLWKNGFRVPRPFLTEKEIEETDLPVMRREVRHSRASDIKLITSMNSFIKGSFYTEFIPSDIEYRFHIMFNQCVRISRKVPQKEVLDLDNYIRSSSTGWTLTDNFEHKPELENEGIKLCIDALKALELDFGACDVVISKKDNLPYLLEVNTCPRLSPFGRKVYLKELYSHLEIPISDELKEFLKSVKDFEFYDQLHVKYRKSRRFKPKPEDYGL